MDELTTIEYGGVTIRVYGMKHNPYFSGSGVAQALGYAHATDALRRYVDAEDKDLLSGLISEYGLYSLIASSGNTQAKRFFTTEVLPEIHRRGFYKPKKSEEKYIRRYEISTGERLTKVELRNMARTFGMSKTEVRQGLLRSYAITSKTGCGRKRMPMRMRRHRIYIHTAMTRLRKSASTTCQVLCTYCRKSLMCV